MAAAVAKRLCGQGWAFSQAFRKLPVCNLQMRTISYTRCLDARLYSDKHEWVDIEDGKCTVGISDFAQNQLGDIVYVEMPEVGTTLDADEVAGCLESVKAASDIYSPLGGTVVETNADLESSPDLVNKSPLEKGWLYKIEVDAKEDKSHLMDEASYLKFVEDQ